MEPLNNGQKWIILSIIERLSSFRGKCIATILSVGASESVLYTEVSFIQSVLYLRFHCISLRVIMSKMCAFSLEFVG